MEWRGGKPQEDVLSALDELSRRVQEIYLHVDLGGFDPEVAPGIVDDPIPGGLSLEDAADAIHAASQRFRMRAATVATFTACFGSTRYIRSMRFRGGSGGFRLCEAVRLRVGADVALTFCNA